MPLYKINTFRQILCCLSLALGCVIWFGHYSLGTLKAGILILLILICRSFFFRPPKAVKYLLILVGIIILSISITSVETSLTFEFIWGFIENLIILIIGYHFAKKHLITNKFLFSVIFIIGAISSLTITNFILGYPNWTSPVEQMRIENIIDSYGLSHFEAIKLYSTGFGLGRTGWSASIALFIPICLYCIDQKINFKTSIILIICLLGSIFVSGSRGGMVVAVAVLCLYFLDSLKYKLTENKILLMYLIFFIVFIAIVTFQDFFIQHLRLDSSDLTTGRNDQYSLIPEMLDSMGFWGLGKNGSLSFLSRHGINYNLHNSYMRNLVDYGWLVGILIFIYLYYILKIIKRVKTSSNIASLSKFACLIVISGLISACFEPSAILGARSWYIVWWFFLGVLLYYNDIRVLNKLKKNI